MKVEFVDSFFALKGYSTKNCIFKMTREIPAAISKLGKLDERIVGARWISDRKLRIL